MNFKPLRKALIITAILVFVSAACICFGFAKVYHGTSVPLGIALLVIGGVIAIGWIAYLAHVIRHPEKNK